MSTQPIRLERQPRHLVADMPQSLDALASTANHEHALCEEAEATALQHALRAGDALNAAHAQVGKQGWRAWAAEFFSGSDTTANRYMRLARYRDKIPADIVTLAGAEGALLGKPPIRSAGRAAEVSDENRAAVQQLAAKGLAKREIARRLGVSEYVVRYWLDPDGARVAKNKARERRRRARQALRQQEREQEIRRAVRAAGAALSEAYSMSARMSGVLAQAEQEATGEARAALEEARAHYHKMSDAIVRALGVS
jgi:transposase